jgi:prolyl-tRNA synthetase
MEAAEALPLDAARPAPAEAMAKTHTPGKAKCEHVAEFLNMPLVRTVKSIVLAKDTDAGAEIWLLLLRGDHELNEVKASKVPGLLDFRFATENEIVDTFGSPPGYLGPIGTKKPVKLVADRTVANMADFCCGANDRDYHYTGVNWGRDLPEPQVADIRNVVAGDPSPDGKGTLEIARGIEVGHIFQLRTKYSEAMKAGFLDEQGQAKPFEMGCYGIGVTRIVAAAIEQNHDARGIIFPAPIAPFEACLVPIGYHKSAQVREAADRLLAQLREAGIDMLMDDRDERPGVLFADMELIGIPHRVVLSERGLAAGNAEYKGRRDDKPQDLPLGGLVQFLKERLAAR